jgi:hypothetical protein
MVNVSMISPEQGAQQECNKIRLSPLGGDSIGCSDIYIFSDFIIISFYTIFSEKISIRNRVF